MNQVERLLPEGWIAGWSPAAQQAIDAGKILVQSDAVGTDMDAPGALGSIRLLSDQGADTFAWSRISVPGAGGGTLGSATNAVLGPQRSPPVTRGSSSLPADPGLQDARGRLHRPGRDRHDLGRRRRRTDARDVPIRLAFRIPRPGLHDLRGLRPARAAFGPDRLHGRDRQRPALRDGLRPGQRRRRPARTVPLGRRRALARPARLRARRRARGNAPTLQSGDDDRAREPLVPRRAGARSARGSRPGDRQRDGAGRRRRIRRSRRGRRRAGRARPLLGPERRGVRELSASPRRAEARRATASPRSRSPPRFPRAPAASSSRRP